MQFSDSKLHFQLRKYVVFLCYSTNGTPCITSRYTNASTSVIRLSFSAPGEMKSTLPSVSAELKAEGIAIDEGTIDRIIDYFDMSADGEIDKGDFLID